MNTPTRHQEARSPSLSRDEVAGLLLRYPHVSDSEAKLILGFLRHGRHLDVGILTADRKLKPQLDSFMVDHAKEFRLGFAEGAVVVGAIATFLIFCVLIWEAAKPVTLSV